MIVRLLSRCSGASERAISAAMSSIGWRDLAAAALAALTLASGVGLLVMIGSAQ
jgi:hypothetical protein